MTRTRLSQGGRELVGVGRAEEGGRWELAGRCRKLIRVGGTVARGVAVILLTVRHRGMGTVLMGSIFRFASVPLEKIGTDLKT